MKKFKYALCVLIVAIAMIFVFTACVGNDLPIKYVFKIDGIDGFGDAVVNTEESKISLNVTDTVEKIAISAIKFPEGAVLAVFSDEARTQEIKDDLVLENGDNVFYVTATYKEKNAEFKYNWTISIYRVSPEAAISSIEAAVWQKEYATGAALAKSSLRVKYTNGTTAEVAVTADMLSGFDTATAGTKTVTITYKGFTTTAEISVVAPSAQVTGIAVKDWQKDLTVGDSFGGGKITVSYDDGSSAVIDITADMLSGFDTSSVGTKTVTITYNGFTATAEIVVSEPVTVTAIEIKEMDTEYTVGEIFGGGKLTVTYSDGSTAEVDITAAMLGGFDTTAAGTKTVTVTYEGQTDSIDVTVSAAQAAVTGIEIKDWQTAYTVGDEFAGGTITVTYDDDSSALIDITAAMLSGFDTASAGNKTVTVTYEGKSDTIVITVSEPVRPVIWDFKTFNYSYALGSAFVDGVALVKYSDSSEEEIAITADMVSGFDTDTIGYKTIAVTICGFENTAKIKVYYNDAPTYDAAVSGDVTAETALDMAASVSAQSSYRINGTTYQEEYDQYVEMLRNNSGIEIAQRIMSAAGITEANYRSTYKPLMNDVFTFVFSKYSSFVDDFNSNAELFLKDLFTEANVTEIQNLLNRICDNVSVGQVIGAFDQLKKESLISGNLYWERAINNSFLTEEQKAAVKEMIERFKSTTDPSLSVLSGNDYGLLFESVKGVVSDIASLDAAELSDALTVGVDTLSKIAGGATVDQILQGNSIKELVKAVNTLGKIVSSVSDNFAGKSVVINNIVKKVVNYALRSSNMPNVSYIVDQMNTATGGVLNIEIIGLVGNLLKELKHTDVTAIYADYNDLAAATAPIESEIKTGVLIARVGKLVERALYGMPVPDRIELLGLIDSAVKYLKIDAFDSADIVKLLDDCAAVDSPDTMSTATARTLYSDFLKIYGAFGSITFAPEFTVSGRDFIVPKGATLSELVALMNANVSITYNKITDGIPAPITIALDENYVIEYDTDTLGVNSATVFVDGATCKVDYFVYDVTSRDGFKASYANWYGGTHIGNEKFDEELRPYLYALTGQDNGELWPGMALDGGYGGQPLSFHFSFYDTASNFKYTIDSTEVMSKGNYRIDIDRSVIGDKTTLFVIEDELLGDIVIPIRYRVVDLETPRLTGMEIRTDLTGFDIEHPQDGGYVYVERGYYLVQDMTDAYFEVALYYNYGITTDRVNITLSDFNNIDLTSLGRQVASYTHTGTDGTELTTEITFEVITAEEGRDIVYFHLRLEERDKYAVQGSESYVRPELTTLMKDRRLNIWGALNNTHDRQEYDAAALEALGYTLRQYPIDINVLGVQTYRVDILKGETLLFARSVEYEVVTPDQARLPKEMSISFHTYEMGANYDFGGVLTDTDLRSQDLDVYLKNAVTLRYVTLGNETIYVNGAQNIAAALREMNCVLTIYGDTISLQAGITTIGVRYRIIDEAFANAPTGLEVRVGKNVYLEGQAFDPTSVTCTLIYGDGYRTEVINIDINAVSGFDSSVTGTQTVTINYMGFRSTFEVNVLESARARWIVGYTDKSGVDHMENPFDTSYTLRADSGPRTEIYLVREWLIANNLHLIENFGGLIFADGTKMSTEELQTEANNRGRGLEEYITYFVTDVYGDNLRKEGGFTYDPESDREYSSMTFYSGGECYVNVCFGDFNVRVLVNVMM